MEQTLATSFVIVVTTCVSVGFLMGAAVFYPIGRRHGFGVALKHWEKMRALTEKPIRKPAATTTAGVARDGVPTC